MRTITCECTLLDGIVVVPMGQHEDVFHTLDQIRHRGAPWWWLLSFRCRVCGQDWLVASEELQNDVYILRRLDRPTAERIDHEDIWPTDFNRYETLLEIGRAAGHAVRFFDVVDSPLLHTIAQLAGERPGIRVSELALLLNLEPSVAADLGLQVVSGSPCRCFVCKSTRVAEPGSVKITFDMG